MSSDHGLATSLEVCKRSTALFSAKQQLVLETITCLCLQTKDLIGTALQALEPRLLACSAALYPPKGLFGCFDFAFFFQL
jgi:hypothetical protein